VNPLAHAAVVVVHFLWALCRLREADPGFFLFSCRNDITRKGEAKRARAHAFGGYDHGTVTSGPGFACTCLLKPRRNTRALGYVYIS
jgi:hypothetical protein